MFHIALYEPQIAPNTGNIIRLVANNGCKLHLIETMGFDLDEKKVRRAGLDYHDLANVSRHKNYQDFLAAVARQRIFTCTTKGSRPYDQLDYQSGGVCCCLVWRPLDYRMRFVTVLRRNSESVFPCSRTIAASTSRMRLPSSATKRGGKTDLAAAANALLFAEYGSLWRRIDEKHHVATVIR